MGAVLDHLGQRLAELLAAGAEGSTIGEAVDRQLRVLARTSLDGYSIGELQSRFPTMELLLDSVRARHSTELGARLAAAHTIALQLGWCLFGDFLRASTGLEDLDDRTFARSIGKYGRADSRRREADDHVGEASLFGQLNARGAVRRAHLLEFVFAPVDFGLSSFVISHARRRKSVRRRRLQTEAFGLTWTR